MSTSTASHRSGRRGPKPPARRDEGEEVARDQLASRIVGQDHVRGGSRWSRCHPDHRVERLDHVHRPDPGVPQRSARGVAEAEAGADDDVEVGAGELRRARVSGERGISATVNRLDMRYSSSCFTS